MAIILNIETATTNCSVSVAQNGALLSIKEHDTPNYSHSEQLHVFMEEVLMEASLGFSDLDAIAISKGPGSYTGLRIGVSAAKGLCFALDVPLISISTLQSMAYQLTVSPNELIIPVLDARRMEVYATAFDHDHNSIGGITAEIIDTRSFHMYVKENRVHLIGSGAEKCKEVLNHPNFSFDSTIVPSAREMGQLSHEKFSAGEFEDVAYFEPFYLKDFILQGKK